MSWLYIRAWRTLSLLQTYWFSPCRYVAANVAMSDGWRLDHQSVPNDLQNRPAHLIQHMRIAYEGAAHINCYAVQPLNNTTFRVASQTGVINTVYFGDDYRGELPFCDCWDWQRTHMPCKHFAAVFTSCRLSWLTLPFFYTSSPILSLDWQCMPMHGPVTVAIQSGTVIQEMPGQLSAIDVQVPPVAPELPTYLVADNRVVAPPPAKSNAARAKNDNSMPCLARKVRNRLSRIRTLSYRVTNAQVLERAKADLETIKQYLEASCVKNDGRLPKPRNS